MRTGGKQSLLNHYGDSHAREASAELPICLRQFSLATAADTGDPEGAGRHAREVIAERRNLDDRRADGRRYREESLNPVGRVCYNASTVICTPPPASLSQGRRASARAQAGEAALRQVAEQGGFTRFRRAAETPFNLILEARP